MKIEIPEWIQALWNKDRDEFWHAIAVNYPITNSITSLKYDHINKVIILNSLKYNE